MLPGVKSAVAVLIVGTAHALFAQPTFDSFEVATIKPTPPDWSQGRFIQMRSGDEFVAKNHTLKTLVEAAYNLSPQAISGGPAWIDSDHYDVLAKTPGNVRPDLDQQMAMLRALLADRFRLSIHRVQKELPVYTLTVANGGSKLKKSEFSPDASPEGPPPLVFVIDLPVVRMHGRYATAAELASVMQRAALDRPVLDQTGLAGWYDFELVFTPDEGQFGGMLGKVSDEFTAPGLFAALQQQLGLKLGATRGMVETLVIDSVERPSAN
jgi:uncharacterized protein (TIGR03435 family)